MNKNQTCDVRNECTERLDASLGWSLVDGQSLEGGCVEQNDIINERADVTRTGRKQHRTAIWAMLH